MMTEEQVLEKLNFFKTKLSEVLNENKTLSTSLETLTAQTNELTAAVDKLGVQLNVSNQIIQHETQEKESIKEKARETIEDKDKVIDLLTVDNQVLTEEKALLEKKLADTILSLENKMNSDNLDKENAENEKNNLLFQIDNLEKEIKALNTRYSDAEKDFIYLKTQLDDSESAKETLIQKLKEKENLLYTQEYVDSLLAKIEELSKVETPPVRTIQKEDAGIMHIRSIDVGDVDSSLTNIKQMSILGEISPNEKSVIVNITNELFKNVIGKDGIYALNDLQQVQKSCYLNDADFLRYLNKLLNSKINSNEVFYMEENKLFAKFSKQEILDNI